MRTRRGKAAAAAVVLFALGLGLVLPGAGAPGSAAGKPLAAPDYFYLENFSITTYRDTTSNTVWDTAAQELRLTSSASEQYSPVLVGGTDNRTFAAWLDSRFELPRIFIQWIDANGNTLLPYGSYLGAGTETFPQAAADEDPDGNAVIAWTANFYGLHTILVNKIAPSGERLWGGNKLALAAGTTDELWGPNIDVDSNGYVVVTWIKNHHAYAQRFSPSGARLWGDNAVQVDRGMEGYWPTQIYEAAPAATSSGNVLITMFVLGDQVTYNNMMSLQKLSASGEHLWTWDKWMEGSMDGCLMLRAEAFDDHAVAAWSNDINPGVYLRHFDLNGAVTYSHYLNAWSTPYSMTTDTSGWMWLVTPQTNGLHFRQYNPSGALAGGPFLVAAGNTYDFSQIASAADSSGNFLVTAWVNKERLYLSRMSRAGTPQWPEPVRMVPSDTVYAPEGTAQSKRISYSGTVAAASISAVIDLNGGQAEYRLSNDGGATWHSMTPWSNFNFPAPGSDLRWQARLTANAGGSASPVLHELRIFYFNQPFEDVLPLKLFIPFVRR